VAAELSLVAGAGGIAPPRPVNFPGRKPTLSEIFAAAPRDGGWAGFVAAQIDPDRPLLWVQERMAILQCGRVHPPGLAVPDLIHVEARDSRAALWAMEEGLRCAGLSAVVGELWGDPAALDFTATRRLAVAAERSGVACWLVRLAASANLSGARMRWRIASLPSLGHPFDPRAPGPSVWDAELFRARGSPPGRWSIAGEPQPDHANRLHCLPAAGDRALDEDHRRSA
jgi:protein ImuA